MVAWCSVYDSRFRTQEAELNDRSIFNLPPKQVKRVLAQLARGFLVQTFVAQCSVCVGRGSALMLCWCFPCCHASERTSEKRVEGRGSLKTECYFIHDRNFVNVVTYRVLKMQQDIAKREQNKVSAVAYVCVGCSPPKQARCALGRFTCITHTHTHSLTVCEVQFSEDQAFQAMVTRGVAMPTKFFCPGCELELKQANAIKSGKAVAKLSDKVRPRATALVPIETPGTPHSACPDEPTTLRRSHAHPRRRALRPDARYPCLAKRGRGYGIRHVSAPY